jgi:hypothetical protein
LVFIIGSFRIHRNRLTLLGNVFVFLLAGHEVGSFPSSSRVVAIQVLQTTAHTLCFSFALLALYPGEQECLYQQIKEAMSSSNGMPVGSLNLNSYRANISVDLSRYEPFHSIISVSSLNVSARTGILSLLAAFSMRLLGYCECYRIALTHRTYSPPAAPQYVYLNVFSPDANDTL